MPGSPDIALPEDAPITDPPEPTTQDFDIAASPPRLLAEQAEHNRRANELRPANKSALFEGPAKAGKTLVTVTFDGYGDSGQIEDITAQHGDDTASLPPDEIINCSAARDDPGFVALTMIVEQTVEQLAYDLGGERSDGGAAWQVQQVIGAVARANRSEITVGSAPRGGKRSFAAGEDTICFGPGSGAYGLGSRSGITAVQQHIG